VQACVPKQERQTPNKSCACESITNTERSLPGGAGDTGGESGSGRGEGMVGGVTCKRGGRAVFTAHAALFSRACNNTSVSESERVKNSRGVLQRTVMSPLGARIWTLVPSLVISGKGMASPARQQMMSPRVRAVGAMVEQAVHNVRVVCGWWVKSLRRCRPAGGINWLGCPHKLQNKSL
jgi:hypothetical protein